MNGEQGELWKREGMDRTLYDHAWAILRERDEEQIAHTRTRTSWLNAEKKAHVRWQKAMFLVEFHEIGNERSRSEDYMVYLAEETPLWFFTLSQAAALLREVYGPSRRNEFAREQDFF